MNSNQLAQHRNRTSISVLLAAASAAQAATVTVTGTDVTLLPAVSVSTGATGTSATGPTQTSLGALGRFDSTFGVLTGAVATASFVPATLPVLPAHLKVGGGTGSASARSTWSLGGNSGGQVVINTATKFADNGWSSISLTSSAANLNNFVGAGNIATNSFASYISVSRSSGCAVYAHPGTTLTAKQVLNYNESITYTYLTHGNASFASQNDTDLQTINLGQIASGASANQNFSIYDRGGLGLTSFTSSFLSGDNIFNVTGVNSIAASSSSLYNAQFLGQTPSVLTNYSGTYRLTFTDNVAGLTQYASNSVGTNYIDVIMNATVAATPEPKPYAMMLAGLGVLGSIVRRRNGNQ
jgi:hypothetical protein